MSITVTTDLSAAPKAAVTITTPDGSAMTAVSLTRTASGENALTRVQPTAGLASRYIEDFEAPWDTDVTYTATITYGSGTTATFTSAPITLTSSQAWAIHPTVPGLSVPIDSGDFSFTGIASLAPISRTANRTLHQVIGSPYPVPVKTGPRSSSTGTLTITTVTSGDEDALWTLIDDLTPLLIRVPASWGWNWEDGYYDIDTATAGRPSPYGPDAARTFTLPYQRVAAPAGDQQSDWSYPTLLATYADYPSLRAAYRDYPSLLGDVRS